MSVYTYSRVSYPAWKSLSFLRRITLSPVSCLAVPYSSTSSHKQYDFRERNVFSTKCVLYFLYNYCLKYFSLQDEFRAIL